MERTIPESKQRVGSFPWMLQRKPEPVVGRPITPKENLRRALAGDKPKWIPMWLFDSQYCWPDVVLEHPYLEYDGKDWYGTEWVWVDDAGGMMVKPGTRVISEVVNWKEEVTFPDLDEIDWEADAAEQTARFDPDGMHLFHLTEAECRSLVRAYVDKYSKYRVVATFRNPNEALQSAAMDELYTYSSKVLAEL